MNNQGKKEYFQTLRENWKKAKVLAEDPTYKEKFLLLMTQSPNLRISSTGFAFCLMSMQANGFEGLPYLDCKTFKGWKEAGFIVKKGEKSKIDGITWISTTKEDEEEGGLYPKMYRLFHSTQVQAL